jgi:WASH complex subunit 7
MNNQFFIERAADDGKKQVFTISVQHVANSIRTHGVGIMNTAVNFTFSFLVTKFRTFSEFMFDNYINSRLRREVTYFKDHRDELDKQFPFERAEAFNEFIVCSYLSSPTRMLRHLRPPLTPCASYTSASMSGSFRWV